MVVQVIVIGSEQPALEPVLEREFAGLLRIASDLGANTLAVLVLEAASCEVAYCRMQEGEGFRATSRIPCGIDLPAGPALLPAESAAARFLASVLAPDANSFFLFPSSTQAIQAHRVAVLFGFADSLDLAAFAAWSVEEVRRLRAELGSANRAFADRKLVERAKLTLQSECGMNERQAYEYLRRMSRQRRMPMSRLAQDLLAAGPTI